MSAKKTSGEKRSSFITPTRVILTALVFSLLAVFGSSSCKSTDEIAKTKESPKISVSPGKPAAPPISVLPQEVQNVELRAVSGAPIKLSDYSGKVLLLNLWATWCGPCRNEIPELVKFHKQYHAQGLEVLGLSTENPDASAEGVRRFVSTYDMKYRVGWATPEVAVRLMSGNNAIPQSFLIARDGRVLKRFVGFSIKSTPPQLKQAIEEALKS